MEALIPLDKSQGGKDVVSAPVEKSKGMMPEAAFLYIAEEIVKESYSAKTPAKFRELLEAVHTLSFAPCSSPFLLDALRTAIYTNKHIALESGNEFDLHRKFRRLVGNDILPSWHIVTKQNDPRHRPDFWVQCGDNPALPVEIKRTAFNTASLRQLNRYMEFYDCEEGFAVAPKLTCELPDNVCFIQLDLS